MLVLDVCLYVIEEKMDSFIFKLGVVINLLKEDINARW
jgi:hypothetical protein